MPRPDEAVHDQPCRAVACSPNARPCGDHPTVLIRAGGYFTFLCFTHAQIESAEAKAQGAHSQARCRQHAYEEGSLPGIKPSPCNSVRSSREGRPVWGWST